ncbi:30S ribosomal protein S11 [Patescibacteria group bacterium]|jgi:small subunit ribosomal protein S11|nr:30S ribosomal protein S11 [Patescibacteria group bacterium]
MGKKKTVTVKGNSGNAGMRARALARTPKKKLAEGTLYIRATFNNTLVSLTDKSGALVAQASSGALGFKGAKKSTPFAAAKVGELVADKAMQMGVKEVNVVIKGAGAGRESAMRAFSNRGVSISAIRDETPVPHNGVRPRKPRRV